MIFVFLFYIVEHFKNKSQVVHMYISIYILNENINQITIKVIPLWILKTFQLFRFITL